LSLKLQDLKRLYHLPSNKTLLKLNSKTLEIIVINASQNHQKCTYSNRPITSCKPKFFAIECKRTRVSNVQKGVYKFILNPKFQSNWK